MTEENRIYKASACSPRQPSKWQRIHSIRGLVNRLRGRSPDYRNDGDHGAPHAHRHRRHFGQGAPRQPHHQQQECEPSDSIHLENLLHVGTATYHSAVVVQAEATMLCRQATHDADPAGLVIAPYAPTGNAIRVPAPTGPTGEQESFGRQQDRGSGYGDEHRGAKATTPTDWRRANMWALVWSKNACGLALVVFEQSAKPFTTLHWAVIHACWAG